MIALMTVILKLEMLQVNMLPHLLSSELSHFWFMVAHLISHGRQNAISELLEPLEVQSLSWITGNSYAADKKQLIKQNIRTVLQLQLIFSQQKTHDYQAGFGRSV